MSTHTEIKNHRVLVIDDNDAIHADFKKIIGRQAAGENDEELSQAAAALFGDAPATVPADSFDIDSAHQGQEGLAKVEQALAEGRPYALAFVDIRMPPGWDGVETVRRIWQVDPAVLVVICTAYSDHTWDDMVRKLGRTDRFLLLKKPFDNIEVRQLAVALTERWQLAQEARRQLNELEEQVEVRSVAVTEHAQDLQRSAREIQTLRDQLQLAREMAAQAQRAKTDFLQKISRHGEMPAKAIANFVALLRDDGDLSRAPPKRLEAIDRILYHTDELLRLFKDMIP
jgi:CheY-like chemotaxis protein